MIDMLLEKLLKGIIDDETYKKRQNELVIKQDKLLIEEKALLKAPQEFYGMVENVFELCKEAPQLYFNASPMKKRMLLKLICSNPQIKSGKALIELNPLFENITNLRCVSYGGG